MVTWSVQARRRPVLRPAMFRDPKWHESCGMPGGDASKANFSSTNLPYSVEINEYYLNAEKNVCPSCISCIFLKVLNRIILGTYRFRIHSELCYNKPFRCYGY